MATSISFSSMAVLFSKIMALNLDFSRLNGAPRITELLLDDVSGYLHWDRVGLQTLLRPPSYLTADSYPSADRNAGLRGFLP